MKQNLVIIGAGCAGAVLAKMLSDEFKITVLEAEKRAGGLCKSYYLDGMVYEFGPHILANHNCSDKAIDFIKSHIEVVDTSLTSASYVNGIYTHYPPHRRNADLLGIRECVEQELENLPETPNEENFETYLVDLVGRTFYDIYFRTFTEKFWHVDPRTLSADWAKTRHLGESLDDEEMFFNKHWCAYPKRDWNELFENLLRGANVLYGVDVADVLFEEKQIVSESGVRIPYDLLISTMSLDMLLGYKFGGLKYTGYDIEPVILDRDYYAEFNGRPISMTYFPEKEFPQGRITDYKTFQRKDGSPTYQKRTIITKETPSDKDLYPYYDDENAELFDRYLTEISKQGSVVTFGRKGLYKYLTTDTTTEMALRLRKHLGAWGDMSPEERHKTYKVIRGDWSN